MYHYFSKNLNHGRLDHTTHGKYLPMVPTKVAFHLYSPLMYDREHMLLTNILAQGNILGVSVSL